MTRLTRESQRTKSPKGMGDIEWNLLLQYCLSLLVQHSDTVNLIPNEKVTSVTLCG